MSKEEAINYLEKIKDLIYNLDTACPGCVDKDKFNGWYEEEIEKTKETNENE